MTTPDAPPQPLRADAAERVGMLRAAYERVSGISRAALGAVTVMALALGTLVPPGGLVRWWLAVVAVAAGRMWLARRFLRLPAAAQAEPRWQRAFVIGAIAAGLTWSLGPLLVLADADASVWLLLSTGILAICAIGLNALAGVPAAQIGFTASALLPCAAALAWYGHTVERLTALVLVGSLWMLAANGRSMHQLLLSLVRSKIELGEALARSTQLAEAERRAAAAREREHQRFDLMIEATGAGTGEWRLDTDEFVFNERWAQSLGSTLAEIGPMTGQRWASMVHPDEAFEGARLLREHLEGRSPLVSFEARVRHTHGHWIWMLVRSRVVERASDGSPLVMMGTHIDISAHKRAEERWQARAVLSADGFWETDAENRFTLWSGAPTDRLGFSREALLGRSFAELPGVVADAADWATLQQRVAAREPLRALVLRVERPGQATRWIEVDGRPRRSSGERFTGYEGVARDVTGRERAAASLAESLAMVDKLFEMIPVPVVHKDEHGHTVRGNRAHHEYQRALRDPASAPGTAADDEARTHDEVDARLLAEGGEASYEVSSRLADGREAEFLVRKATLQRADGRVAGLVGVAVDITERKAAERALASAKASAEAASRAKSAFLATMSHELRTPLNAVIGAAQLLGDIAPDAPERGELVQAIVQGGRNLLGLIENIMDLSRIEAGAVAFVHEPFDLSACCEQVVSTVALGARAKGLHIDCVVEPTLAARRVGDAQRLRQLLLNLLGNAVKFTAQGEVVLRVFAAGDERVRFEVRDSGIGIAREQLLEVFEPFRQGEDGTNRRFGGSGLGLAIVRELVQAMGGRVWADSTPGVGTVMSMELPLAAAADAAAPAPASAPTAPAAAAAPAAGAERPLQVLVVEDDPLNRTIVLGLLRHAGITASGAIDGHDALERIAAERFDLVLMDWHMPDIDGLEVTRRLRAGAAGMHGTQVPIVALTANAFAEDRAACLAAGMNDFITKPVHTATLLETVRRWAAAAPHAEPAR